MLAPFVIQHSAPDSPGVTEAVASVPQNSVQFTWRSSTPNFAANAVLALAASTLAGIHGQALASWAASTSNAISKTGILLRSFDLALLDDDSMEAGLFPVEVSNFLLPLFL